VNPATTDGASSSSLHGGSGEGGGLFTVAHPIAIAVC
jgi:hypothetical protein